MTVETRREPQPPPVSKFLTFGFVQYSRRFIARRFCAMRVLKGATPKIDANARLLVYMNHAGWWDPIIAALVNDHFFSPRTSFAPMDALALKQYPILERLGFYPVNHQGAAGMRDFLTTSNAILQDPANCIFITPQGRFADVREAPVFESGLSHLATRIEGLFVIPLAVEYAFWNESTPEVLLAFGEPVDTSLSAVEERTKRDWNEQLQQQMAELQEQLAAAVIARDPQAFDTLIGGRAGVGGIYDIFRRTRSWLTGRLFRPEHASIAQPAKEPST